MESTEYAVMEKLQDEIRGIDLEHLLYLQCG